MNSKLKLVSVIIPTYNREKYLREAIISVSNQSYSEIEILVIDDGSSTNYAEEICKNFKNCRYYYKNNGGLSSARNFGIKKAKGDFIAFLDDDDFWRNDKLEKQLQIFQTHSKIDCVHSSASVVNEKSQEKGYEIGASDNKAYKRSGYVFWNALGVWVVKSPTPLIKKEVFKNNLFFDETIKVGEDIDFYQRMFFRHKVYYINEPLAFYREYENYNRLSLQTEKYLGIEKKIFKNFLKMGIKNPFILNRIASKLLVSAIKRNNLIKEKEIKLNFFDKFIFPRIKLTKI